MDESPCGKLSTGFCLILIKLFALAVHRSSRKRLEKTRQASLLLGLATVLACIFWLVGCLFFSTVWQRGITCLLPTINLGSINPRRTSAKTSICYVPSIVSKYLAKLFDFYTKCLSFFLTLHDLIKVAT